MLEKASAIRFVTPLREGGSLPGVVEADDLGTWVMKFRGAGQGLKVLVAEVIVGELGRALDIPVPELKAIELPEQIARYEADEEVQDLLTASVGLNLGVDLLPGAFEYDESRPPPTELAAKILWLDAFTANIDRTAANPNLLRWHRRTWCIDHGAALYFHHGWPTRRPDPARFAATPFDADSHVLRPVAGDVAAVHDRLAATAADGVLLEAIGQVPDEWLEPVAGHPAPDDVRGVYLEHLVMRRDRPDAWLPGAPA